MTAVPTDFRTVRAVNDRLTRRNVRPCGSKSRNVSTACTGTSSCPPPARRGPSRSSRRWPSPTQRLALGTPPGTCSDGPSAPFHRRDTQDQGVHPKRVNASCPLLRMDHAVVNRLEFDEDEQPLVAHVCASRSRRCRRGAVSGAAARQSLPDPASQPRSPGSADNADRPPSVAGCKSSCGWVRVWRG